MASLFVNELTVIDFSYLDVTRGVVGESWILDVTLNGELNDEGMVFDFGLVKKQIKHAVDEGLDHKFLIPARLPGLQILQDDEDFHFEFHNDQGLHIEYKSPREAIYLLNSDQLDIDQVSEVIRKHLMTIVPENVSEIKIGLYPQAIQGAFYHYSHGLKKHQGDCQRICHGHRSPIEIVRNGQRDEKIETSIANLWRDIYLITKEDLLAENDQLYVLGYESEQGHFELSISKDRCYLFDTDTTVELIADHLAHKIQNEYPNDSIEVRAFEGFKKGAIAGG